MVNMTIALPDELHEKMRRHSEIKWSEIARRAIRRYVEEMDRLDKLTSDSKLTEEDADEIGHEVKRDLAKRYRKYTK